ncbi:bacillithiol biosynthesis cysteine-adding enzyme BshC [Phaeocystidibacter luteus]|nr:bacillithiol biosynthesis cysteine-adding enzyme BshC [Phaeocystidibacter luteus]
MQHKPVPIFSTGRFSKLMEDYVNEDSKLRPLYNRPHKRSSYEAQLQEKSQHLVDRALLAEVLTDQYASLDIAKRYPLVHEAIDQLALPESFTVTTGHQVCLFTGPLYFIYKIVNTIRLAEELTESLKKPVLPIFWMATEDHDFEEVNHVWYGDIKYRWERPFGGGVGRMNTDGVEEVVDQLQHAVGESPSANELLDLFRRCYRPGNSLAQATRELATSLFGHKGLIVLDADDARLKSKMTGYFKDELLNRSSSEIIEPASQVLNEYYFTQVNPREINLFYLNNETRYRLDIEDGVFKTVDGPYTWSAEEITAELEQFPERFSPNVILRPLYQEVILPNLAYIGGGGELAYWLQLKPLFDRHMVPFPILRLRNSVGFMRRKFVHKMESLNLSLQDICEPVFEQRRNHFKKELELNGQIDSLKAEASVLFQQMHELADKIDPTLKGTAEAYNARQTHLIENFEKKILRAIQRRESEVSRMFDEIHAEAFPSGGLQERRDTYLTLVERFGGGVMNILFDEIDPFAHDFSWFIE